MQDTPGPFANGEVGGWIKGEDLRRGGLHGANGRLLRCRLSAEGARVEGAIEILQREHELAQLIGRAARTGEGLPGGFALLGQGAVDLQGVRGALALFEHAGNLKENGRLIGSVACRDEELGAGASEVVPGDEVLRQLEADIAAAVVAVAFPGAVEGGLVVVDGEGLLILAGGQAGELQIDDAASGFGVAEGVEIGDGLVDASGFGKSFGELNLSGAVRLIGERGAEGVNGDVGIALCEGHLTAAAPTVSKLKLMVFEGMEKEVGEAGNGDDDEHEADEGDGILKYEAAKRGALLGRQRVD